jgi:small subunit ribosomal protein S4e
MTSKGETKCLKVNNATSISSVSKTTRFVYNPKPGKHSKVTSISIGFVLKHLLNVCDNTKEVKYIINNREIVVDKKLVKMYNLPVGLYDVIEIPKLDKYYTLVYSTNGSYVVQEIQKDESNYKICKITSKKLIKKGQVQLSTNDGRVLLTQNQAYKVGASIKLDLLENTIKEYFPLEKGREVFVFAGKHTGQKGVVQDTKESTMKRPALIKLKSNGIDFETVEKNIIVIN